MFKILFTFIGTFIVVSLISDWLIGFDPNVKRDPDMGFGYLPIVVIVGITTAALVSMLVSKRLNRSGGK